MNNTNYKTSEQMTKAIAAYSGPVTQCPPGEARAKPVKVVDKAERWLEQHSNDVKDPRAERRQMRMARAQRERIARRNAAITRGR